jgi:NAD-dependent deacetylase
MWEATQATRAQVRQAQPNAGHQTLAAWERCFERVTIITQNVDNLHQRAGSSQVLELHGNLERNITVETLEEVSDADLNADVIPYRSHRTGQLVRPAVVYFGEALPQTVVQEAQVALQHSDVLLVVGTSLVKSMMSSTMTCLTTCVVYEPSAPSSAISSVRK